MFGVRLRLRVCGTRLHARTRRAKRAQEISSGIFSPGGSRVVPVGDSTARLWDAASGRAIVALTGHEGSVRSAAFSSDATRIVTASDDETARIWDVTTILKGNILQVACAYRRMQRTLVSLEGVTEYPLTFDRPICAADRFAMFASLGAPDRMKLGTPISLSVHDKSRDCRDRCQLGHAPIAEQIAAGEQKRVRVAGSAGVSLSASSDIPMSAIRPILRRRSSRGCGAANTRTPGS